MLNEKLLRFKEPIYLEIFLVKIDSCVKLDEIVGF